jgi:hypothetical protein
VAARQSLLWLVANGTTVTALPGVILGSIQSQLASAVSSGKMTSAQEIQIYTKLQQFMGSPNWDTQLQKIGHKPGGQ